MSDQYLSVVPQSGTTTNTHSRSSSFRNRPRPKLSLKIDSRPRSDSVPQIYLSVADSDNDIRTENAYDDSNSAHQGGGLCRVRSFKKTSKGVLNVGDKFKSKSTNSLKSGGSFISLHETDKKPSRTTSMTSMDSGASSAPSFFRVMVLGSDGVGKSTLIRQFMTSENLGPYEPRTRKLLCIDRFFVFFFSRINSFTCNQMSKHHRHPPSKVHNVLVVNYDVQVSGILSSKRD